MTISKLKAKDLYKECQTKSLGFKTTAELAEMLSSIGQDRAIKAVEMGVDIRSKGYNLFCLGAEGTGKASLVKKILKQKAAQRETPMDWCYVNNFKEAHKPRAIALKPGRAEEFAKDMKQFAENISDKLSNLMESDEYKKKLEHIEHKYESQKEDYILGLQNLATSDNVKVMRMPTGLVVAPVKDGNVLGPEEFENLAQEEKEALMDELNIMQERLEVAVKESPAWEGEQAEEIEALQEKQVEKLIKAPLAKIRKNYKENRDVLAFLRDVETELVENSDSFTNKDIDQEENDGEEENGLGMILEKIKEKRANDMMGKFEVNSIIKHKGTKGAPIVYLDHPTQGNLIGKVERIQQYGALLSDFTLIKAGALHEANGGFLLIDARKLLTQPNSWDCLKRAIRSKQIKIEAIDDSSFTTISIDPEPIPLEIKVILIGEYDVYSILSERDPDFSDLFKVEADFASVMHRTKKNETEYAKLIGSLSKKKQLRSLNKQAVAKIIEHSSRIAGSSEKLTAHIASVGDLIKEADYWAKQAKSNTIGKKHIDEAINAQYYRNDRVREVMLEQIEKGTIMIDTETSVVGQINGLVVYDLNRICFGKPAKITCQTRIGRGEFIDIEREIELSGPIHTKGTLILKSLLANKFAKDRPLSLSTSTVFEQSYGGVDGDSASSTEYYALLSSLSDVPIKQSIAVTGSIDQFGHIQPIGGANEKIEGFFDVCKAKGLNGKHGAIIPRTNIESLMLREDVVQACKDGLFTIYAIDTVDDGIEILTGKKAGIRNGNGEFPKGSINYLVEEKLKYYHKRYVEYAKETYGATGG